jgi:hypothetical protein
VAAFRVSDQGRSPFRSPSICIELGFGSLGRRGPPSVASGKTGATSAITVGAAALNRLALAGGDLQMGAAKTDWSNFVETNDYSYGANATYADTTKVTVYVYGNLVWGTEP